MEEEKKELLTNHNWKNKDKKYLFELQKFLDLIDNIGDEILKKEVIYQFTSYDKTLTDLAENIITKFK